MCNALTIITCKEKGCLKLNVEYTTACNQDIQPSLIALSLFSCVLAYL